jgi:hypothetical protein
MLPPTSRSKNKPSSASYLLHASFLLGLLFDLQDGADMFLQNTGWLSVNYMALYPRKQNSSKGTQPVKSRTSIKKSLMKINICLSVFIWMYSSAFLLQIQEIPCASFRKYNSLPQSLQTNAGIIPYNKQWPLASNLSFTNHLTLHNLCNWFSWIHTPRSTNVGNYRYSNIPLKCNHDKWKPTSIRKCSWS